MIRFEEERPVSKKANGAVSKNTGKRGRPKIHPDRAAYMRELMRKRRARDPAPRTAD